MVPAKPEERLEVVRSVSSIPMISAEQYQHVGKFAGAVVLHVFEQIGGASRMANWADQNPTDFYTKLLPKVIQRSQQVDHTVTHSIDDAINRLDAEQGEYREIHDALPPPEQYADFEPFEAPQEYDL